MNFVSGWIQSFERAADAHFLAPLFLGFLALIPIVIILYLLKLRRTEVVISSTLIWLKSLQDLTANAPFQRLRKNLLLFLQILVLLLVAFALARPFFRAEGTAGRNLCILLDRSASMQTIESGGTRMEIAKQHALDMVEAMEKGDKTMLVTFAENSGVLCELTDDRARLRRAIKDVTPADACTRLRDALLVAKSLRASVGDLHLVVVSDGKIDDLPEIGTQALDMSFLQVGQTTLNAGIAALSMRDPLEGQGEERQTFVLVHNAHTEPLVSTLTLSFNDEVLAIEEVQVPPLSDGEFVFAHASLGKGVLRADLDVEDALTVDDTASLTVRPAALLKVLLVSTPDTPSAYFLQRVLVPDPRVSLSVLAPEEYMTAEGYDLTIFDSFAPQELPEGTVVFLNALPPVAGVTVSGEFTNPPIIALDSEHPMLRFNLNPSNVGIRKALDVTLPENARSLVDTTGGSLVADLSRGGQQILLIAFDIADTDWPLHLSFPLFFQNLIAWVPRISLASDMSVQAGRPIALMPQADVASVRVKRPDGGSDEVELDPMRPVYYAQTTQAGLYEVSYGERVETYAVNLLSLTESDIGAAESLSMGTGNVEAQQGNVRQNKELWRWLVLGGLLVLMVEWAIYCRRAWI